MTSQYYILYFVRDNIFNYFNFITITYVVVLLVVHADEKRRLFYFFPRTFSVYAFFSRAVATKVRRVQ